MASKPKLGADAGRPAPLSTEEVRRLLKLEPLATEGGFFAETYRSKIELPQSALPVAHGGARLASSAIYYMLTPETFSAMHRVAGDEIFHFYLGDTVEMLMLKPDGTGQAVLLGQDITAGMKLQHVVPGGVWQGARLAPGGRFALLGTTMSPGFDPADFTLGIRAELAAKYPMYSPLITLLTR